jgi:hypothetical protein
MKKQKQQRDLLHFCALSKTMPKDRNDLVNIFGVSAQNCFQHYTTQRGGVCKALFDLSVVQCMLCDEMQYAS